MEIFTNGDICEHGIRLSNRKIYMKKLACGAEHTIGLSTDGEIWVWGSGIQLGLGEITCTFKPQKVSSIAGKNVLDVCCGETYSMVLVEKSDSDHSSHSRPLQKATITKIQKHYPSQCVACKKEIYTYTETNDTCIIEEAHDCRMSVNGNIHSMDSSSGSNGTDSSQNLTENAESDSDASKIRATSEDRGNDSRVSATKQVVSVSESLSSADGDSHHCNLDHRERSDLSEGGSEVLKGSQMSENKSQTSKDESQITEERTDDVLVRSPGSNDHSRKLATDDVKDKAAYLDPLGILPVGGEAGADVPCDAGQTKKTDDPMDTADQNKADNQDDRTSVHLARQGQTVEAQHQNEKMELSKGKEEKNSSKDLVDPDNVGHSEVTEKTESLKDRQEEQDCQDVLEESAGQKETMGAEGHEAPRDSVPDEDGACGQETAKGKKRK